MGIKFKCLQSGNEFEFHTEHDIKTMRTHPGYQEVLQEVQESEDTLTIRKPGRPKKTFEEQ
jgi:hypothetical protein